MDNPKPNKMFVILSWLNKPHGVLTRGILAVLGYLLVMAFTFSSVLAAEVAGLMKADQTKLAAHRISFYLHHGWTARFTRQTPFFDPTTSMNPKAVRALDAWLGQSRKTRDLLARLYVLARDVRDADAVTQPAILDAYTQTATALMPDFPAPDPQKAPSASNEFSLDDAKASLVALRALPCPWYIISGTFLGAVREGTFLAHDYDVDIGVHAEDFDEAAFLAAVHTAPDLTYVNQSPALTLNFKDGYWQCTSTPALYRVLHKSGIGIDVFIHHLDGTVRWHGSARHRWDNSEFALADYTIAGLVTRGPADADRYLTENYGGWRVPVKSFSCSTGTPNVSFPYNLSAVAEMLCLAITRKGGSEAEIARLVLVQEGYARHDSFQLPWR